MSASGVLLLPACGGGTTPSANSTPSSDPSSSTSATSSALTATATSSPESSSDEAPATGQPVANGLCKAPDVTLSLGPGDSGAGSTYRPLLIKNKKQCFDHICRTIVCASPGQAQPEPR
ncbi:hypothetical protein [Amycolatopsis sp. FDAARGOS 1241]|uniref:hypothetical protein n=1 Tax=Amycolatopsis sp. FDAARGOS 1241 TaxID=2778070 RepID=UPI001951E120|nr:hypothetical protein [Amycolatopsis sp. FDAARGOS 1241]QRP42656.1 hypothetical protein I6J71_24440 [Amycolatopsis sp. FDAARGOS 1241]